MINIRNHYWLVGDGPADHVYSSAAARLVPLTDPAFVSWGGEPSAAVSAEWLADYLLTRAPDCIGEGLPIPRHGVMTYTMVRRLEVAGKVEAALAALETNATAKWLFTTARWIWSDDQLSLDLLTQAGADPAVILAPDPNWSSAV
jgi:hypothetical protein